MLTSKAHAHDVVVPASEAEAVAAFGSGHDVTVMGGGTILEPDLAYGRYPAEARTLMLHRAGLDRIERDGDTVHLGATTTLRALADAGIAPLDRAASDIADPEIRAQATVGGNVCVPAASPYGDLRVPLLALDAQVRFADGTGIRRLPVQEFLAQRVPRLVLGIEFEPAERAAYLSQRRRHAHSYAVMTVACVQRDGTVRLACSGHAAGAARLPTAERALAAGRSAHEAAAAAADDVEPISDALASAWYRGELLPVLVERVLDTMGGQR